MLPEICLSYLIPKLLHSRIHQAATPGKAIQRDTQGEQDYLCGRPSIRDLCLPQYNSITPAVHAGNSEEQAGLNISRLAPHLQHEWNHAANAHLGSSTVTPKSERKVWWTSGVCKTGQPHRWQATVSNRSRGKGCPYDSGKAVCPCKDLAHSYPEVAADWDWEDTRECDRRQPFESSLEVCPLWAQLERLCVQQNKTARNWMPPVCP